MIRIFKTGGARFAPMGFIKRIVILILLSAVLVAVYIFPRILIDRDLADIYCGTIFSYIAFLPNAISDFFIFSLTEMAVVIGSILLLGSILLSVVKLIKRLRYRGIRYGIYRISIVLQKLLILSIIAMMIFQLMHGINYRRTSIAEHMHFTGAEHSYDEYSAALLWAYNGMVTARNEIGEDAYGVGHMKTSFDECVGDANALMDTVSLAYGFDMSDNFIRAKSVMLSHYWSYTGISGVYDAFIGEANVNTDYIDILYFPVTLCHEISHAKGYAREYDANMAAVLACIRSPRADFRYAGYYAIFSDLYSKTYSYAEHEGLPMPIDLSDPSFEPVIRDIRASVAYDETLEDNPFTRLVDSFSESANNAFLEANGQTGGTDTYVVPISYYVDYYCMYVSGAL